MRETQFHRELLDYYRRRGWWARKWPDQVASAMKEAGHGGLRFSLPKPFDLVLCSSEGQFGAVECKLVRGPTFRIDDRARKQIETLLALPKPAYTALAINFRYTRKRTGRVNRAFLAQLQWLVDELGEMTAEYMSKQFVELRWVPRTGWTLAP